MSTAALQWLHLIGAALWVGSQVFLALVVIPSLRALDDPAARRRVLLELTGRYNVLGWASLALLVGTGSLRAYSLLSAPDLLVATAYGRVLLAKLALVALLMVLAAVHALRIGPRLLALAPASEDAPSEEYVRVRRRSLVVSALTLLLSLAILAAAAVLRTSPF